MRLRFPNTDLFEATDVFDHQNIQSRPSSLASYGDEQLDVLLGQFEESKEVDDEVFSAPIDADTARTEWQLLKQITFKHYRSLKVPEFWNVVEKKHSHTCPQLLKLATICLSLPLSTASCERALAQNHIYKNQVAKYIIVSPMIGCSRLMRISIEVPKITEFEFCKAPYKWN